MNNLELGTFCSSFDPFHPGYLWAMDQAISAGICTGIIACIHVDPSVEWPDKVAPVMTLEERTYMLSSLRQVREVVAYETEEGLRNLLETIRPVVHILGEDYRGQPYTGNDLPIPVFYADRRPEWSGTEFRRRAQETWGNVAPKAIDESEKAWRLAMTAAVLQNEGSMDLYDEKMAMAQRYVLEWSKDTANRRIQIRAIEGGKPN